MQRVRQRRLDRTARDDGNPHKASSPNDASAKKSERNRSFKVLFLEFLRLLKGNRRKVILGLIAMSASTILGLLPPLGTKLAIDSVLTEPPIPLPEFMQPYFASYSRMQLLWVIAGTVVLVMSVKTVIYLMGRWLATQAVNQTSASVRRRVFDHALQMPLQSIYKIKSGGITSILREDAGGVSELIFSMLFNPSQAIVQLIGSLCVLIFVDWRLMASAFLILPAVYFSHRTWIYSIRPLYRDVRSQRQQIDASATETFSGIRVVRTFARQKTESGRFVRGNHMLVRQQLMVWWRTRLIEIVWEVLIPLSSTVLLVYGGWQILNAQLTIGELMMFLVYLTMLLGPIATLASTAVQFQNNLAGLDRITDLLEAEPEMIDAPDAVAISKQATAGDVTIANLSFKYPENPQWILQDIHINVRAGQTIALVGRSGAGKTTLCNLIARFYDPTEGAIELDGIDLNKIKLHSFRRLLGVVEQDLFLFDGSIAENIAYGRRNATRQEIEDAARAAAADEFIRQTAEGYQTIIGERGVKLSGGQRQRLAIARALLSDPKILILDEATSNLDSESEQAIQSSLSRLLHGRTAFVIAHRLSTIMHADQILVLDQGRIAERGTHEELLANDGIYRRMVTLQTEGTSLVQS